MKWPVVTLSDVADVIPGFAFKSSDLGEEGVPVLKIGNILEDGSVDTTKTQKFPQNLLARRHEKFWVNDGDILLAMTGATAGKMGRVRASERAFLLNQRVAKISARSVNTDFLWLQLNTAQNREQIFGLAGGAAQPNISGGQLERLKISLPDESTQEGIASTLSNFDRLIENNRRRIKLLEVAARLIYREWFVRLRFPGHELIKIDNGIPEDWQRMPVAKAIDFNPKETLPKGGIRFVPMGALSESGMTVEANLTEIRESGTTVKFRNGDTLLARITPCLENGKTAFVGFLSEGEVASGSTEFIVMRGARVGPCFTYCLARSEDFRGIAVASMVGSSGRQRAQVSVIGEFSILLPPLNLLDDFESLVQPMFDQIWTLVRANERLVKARDLLLPRLMSGEIEV